MHKTKFKLNLQWKITTAVLIVLLFSAILNVFLVKRSTYSEIEKQHAELGFSVLNSIGTIIDEDKIEELLNTKSENNPYYNELNSILNGILSTNDIAYLYIEGKDKNGDVVIIADGEDPNSEDFSPLGTYVYTDGYTESEEFIQLKNSGEMGYLVEEYDDESILSCIYPIKKNDKILATITLDISIEDIKVSQGKILTPIIILRAIEAITIILILACIIYFMLGKPLKSLMMNLSNISNGDYTSIVSEKLLNRNDEIAEMADSVLKVNTVCKSLTLTVIEKSNNVNNECISSSDLMTLLSDSVTDINNATNNISSYMTDTASSAEELSSSFDEITKAIEVVNQKAENGATLAMEISTRAEKIKENAIVSENISTKAKKEIDEKMAAAISQSKAVDKIQVLTDNILSITSQTNLLALNASIEAARAGEAGKGFAVVADEIRKLAEMSEETVNKISTITHEVSDAVMNLVTTSKEALSVIDNTIESGSKALLDASSQYAKDSDTITDITTDLSSIAEEVASSVETMKDVVDNVTSSVSEGAEGTSEILAKTIDIQEQTINVSSSLNNVQNYSVDLKDLMSQLKI